MREILISLLLLLIITSGCEKEARISSKDYPYVITKDPDVVENGAVFYAELLNTGTWKVLRYGFVCEQDGVPSLSNSNKIFIEKEAFTDKYSFRLNSGLIKGKTYFVRAYILTDKYEIYGNAKSFKSYGSMPPEITSFSPKSGPIGTHVTIEGKNFAIFKSENVVKFGNIQVIIDSASESRLLVTIPDILKPEKVPISVEASGMTISSKDSFDLWFPWKRMNDFKEGYNGLVSFSTTSKAYVGLGNGITSFWEYDPVGNRFIRKSDFPYAVNAFPVCFSINNNGYVIFSNGNNHYPETSTISELWEYNSIEDKWTRKADFPGLNRNSGVAFSIDNKGYFGTGEYVDKYQYVHYPKDFWEYEPITDKWTRNSDFPGADRARSFGFSLGSNGYVGGGSTGWAQNSVYRFSPQTDTWTYIGEYPGNGYNYINGFIINNKYYMGLGGNNSGSSFSDFWVFEASDNSWKKMRSCPISMDATMAFSINNKGYIGVGLKDYMDTDENRKIVFEFDPAEN
jgi:N-acetylneuraminic acid mutarotase